MSNGGHSWCLAELASRCPSARVESMRPGRSTLVTLLLVGCAADAEGDGGRDCISDHPPDSPFDVGDVDVASPAPGSGGLEPEAPTAASCLAQLNGFKAGLEAWRVALVYHHGHDRVVWNVMNRLNDRGAEGYSGGALTLDATDGHVLGHTAYEVTR